MEATERELEALIQLQEVDVSAINTRKKADDLPQRGALEELAGKRGALSAKLAEVDRLADSARRKLARLEDETEILMRKQDDLQQRIDDATGDFRAVQSLTRDMDGVAKRLTTLEGELEAAQEKARQVDAVKRQIDAGIAAIDAQAAKLRESFAQDRAKLQEKLDSLREEREGIAADVSAALLKQYDDACRRGGGVGVARLQENRCGTCRSLIDSNRLLVVRREAPLSHCPSCRRLLIVG